MLYGHDLTERIVALHPVGPGTMRVYRRTPEDAVTWEDERYHPFFLLDDIDLLKGFPRDRFQFQPLAGSNAYQWLVVFPDAGSYWDARRHIQQASDTQKERPDAIYFVGGPEQQYLMQTGRTLFKGMELHDLHRLQFDLEVYSERGFPQAEVPEHRIILVALSDNRGWSRVVGGPLMDEQSVLEETLELMRERDPDVIEGHNVFGFDLPYLAARCRRHGVPLALGRDGSEPRSFPSSMRFAERQIEFEAVEIAGRHIVDTLFQVMSFDVFSRDLPNYTLKGVAKYFGFAPEGRTYIEGEDIAQTWREDPQRLIDYALDDVIETAAIAEHLSGSTFYLTQMVPMPYGQCARSGPASKIESLFVRGYLHARHSVPRAEAGSQIVGGYTDVFMTGVVGPVVYADVESLYPSIMLNYGVQPRRDALGIFPRLLQRLTDLRFVTKRAMREASGENETRELDARQTAYKNIINSFYGNMGFGFAAFNDFAEADRVAATGQKLLRQIMALIRDRGGRIVEVDTDGVLFVPPPEAQSASGDAERAFVSALSEKMPEGIRIGFDGRFERMLSFKKKTYALLGYDGTLKVKGSSLVSRSTERFGRRFVRRAIELLLAEDVAALHALYLNHRQRIIAHDWDGVASFQRIETLKQPLARYERDVRDGKRNRPASYELAKQRAEATGEPVRIGDRIAFYIAGGGGRVFEAAKLASEWDPADPDEDTAHYIGRLDQFASKFSAFFETDHAFRQVFSEEDLFGFDARGIRLAVRERAPEDVTDDVPF
ncbi:DNA polymerase [Rubricoccus marinus]|uniref:DNA-directed DNA polymerase n=1 Tax=Rubricoccus marinus TaxID=716817 RepID=A0A259U3Z0_9BACT|nr:DNA polymerase [Rubricoccus marinus]